MTKGRIINAVFVLSVLGIALSVYLFYFKEKLETYSQDKELGKNLQRALDTLTEDFAGRDPEWLSTQWRTNIPTWTTTITNRANYFSYGDWTADIPQAEEERTLKFWYDEVMRKMVMEFYTTEVYPKIRPDLFPDYNQFLASVRVETLDQWANQDIGIKRVNLQLTNLTFGFAAANLLLDHNVSSVTSLNCLPPVTVNELNGITQKRTIDTVFTTTAENLVELLETLRISDRYFTVEALKVQYPYIASPYEPQLQVAMVLTQSAFNKKKLEVAKTGTPVSLSAVFDNRLGRQRGYAGGTPKKKNWLYIQWKKFKRFYFASN